MIVDDLAKCVTHGLSNNQMFLEPKFLYDKRGSEIFEEITQLDEYYPTKTELSILETYNDEICNFFGNETPILVELGSGSSMKTRTLIESIIKKYGSLHYIPIDISYEILKDSSIELIQSFSNLKISAIASDYEEGLKLVSNLYSEKAKLIIWLGSSIGNLNFDQSINFLKKVNSCMSEKDRLLIGMDMIKDTSILLKAYNDSKGVTANFNKNILLRINKNLGGNFSIDEFEHQSIWNEDKLRVEMHLISKKDQEVEIKEINKKVKFKKGETIHTESCQKYTNDKIEQIAKLSNLKIRKQFFDNRNWFSLNLFSIE